MSANSIHGNKARHDGSVNTRDRGRFGRRKQSAVDASQNDKRSAERPDTAPRRARTALAKGSPFRSLPGGRGTSRRGQKSCEQESGKHPPHRDAAPIRCRRAIYDHRHARRNDDVDRTDSRDKSGGKGFRYPARRIAGYITLPIVATHAALAPEIAPKIADVPTVVTPRLPRTSQRSPGRNPPVVARHCRDPSVRRHR